MCDVKENGHKKFWGSEECKRGIWYGHFFPAVYLQSCLMGKAKEGLLMVKEVTEACMIAGPRVH